MHTRLVSWSRYVFLAGIVLALVLVIPAAWFPFQLAKVAAFALCLTVASALFIAGGGARSLLRTHGFFAALAVLALPLLYAISAALSPERSHALGGFSVETDTVLFVILAALAYLLSFTFFRTLRTARLLTTVVFWSLAAAAVFQLVSVLFGSSAIPFDAFADRTVNLIGKWNDLGLIAALLGLLLLVRVELGPTSQFSRIASAVAGALLVVLLALVNFAVAWALLLAGCVVIALLSLIRQRADNRAQLEEPARIRWPWYAASGAAVALLFLLYGGPINTSLTKVLPVSSLEVRPGLSATMDVIGSARGNSLKNMLVGTGPSTFGPGWLAYKPAEVNQTPFWNLDFNVGYSVLATAFGTVGLLGALAWLIPLFLLIAAVVRAARVASLSREERVVATLLALGSLFLLATVVLYVPSQNIIILGYALSGAAFGFLWRQGRSAQDEQAPGVGQGIGVIMAAAGLLVLAAASGVMVERRFVSQAYAGAGLYELRQGNIDTAMARLARAAAVEPAPDALRIAADAGAQKLNSIARDSSLTREQAQTAFTAQVTATIAQAQAAIAAAPSDYRAYYLLAQVYDFLATLKIQGAYGSAQQAYAAAAVRNPTNPVIPLALSKLEAGQGNAKNMEAALTKSLQLKPDYTDAILFVVQINVANNDLASAIRNTAVAVRTAPGVPSLWFELGLLYYAGGDTKNAIVALEQAVALAPEYANAKYFLGLSYAVEGNKDKALALFLDLAASNPDNAEIKAIVANLATGKQPQEGTQTPPPPQTPTTAPVSQ